MFIYLKKANNLEMYKLSKSFSQFITQKELIENSTEYLNEILKSLNDGFDLNKFNLILQKLKISNSNH
jgi:hypothetical protein